MENENYRKVIPIDSVGILEIDKSVYDWFDKTHRLTINDRKVPVIFGSWERFAQIQGNKEDNKINTIRDKNGKVKIPLIQITRSEIGPNENRTRKLSNDGEPSIVFRKEIAASKFNSERRIPFNNKWKVGSRYFKSNPIYNIYRIPMPSFVDINYSVTFWASYVAHINQFHENIWKDYIVGDLKYKNYYFHARFESSSDDSNVEDFSTDERILKHSFQLIVEGYLIDKEKKVIIDRTPSNIVFEEQIIDGHGISELDEISMYK